MDEAQSVLTFWFEESAPEQWFKKDDAFDQQIKERFGLIVERALNGELENWSKTDDGLLALIIVLDQFTRNIFRNDPKSFAGDATALALSFEGQNRGMLERLEKSARHFLLVPMMHSEELEVQDASLPLFKNHTDENTHGYAIAHRDIIAQFGRFPHRNKVLGRSSTKEELEFLEKPGSSF